MNGKVLEEVGADKNLFAVDYNKSVVRQAVLAEMTNLRQGTHSSKNRSAVRGGGKKPWKQKGRGVARAGTIRSPLWKGGGTVFGPTPHGYKHKLPKKIGKLARRSVFSYRFAKDELIVLDKIQFKSHKTSEFVSFLKKLNVEDKKITLLVSKADNNLILSSRNVKNVYIENAKNVSVYDLLDSDILLFDKSALEDLIEVLA
jgi:large subunit ribosomal protein L4